MRGEIRESSCSRQVVGSIPTAGSDGPRSVSRTGYRGLRPLSGQLIRVGAGSEPTDHFRPGQITKGVAEASNSLALIS
jgi:hypothetical protein